MRAPVAGTPPLPPLLSSPRCPTHLGHPVVCVHGVHPLAQPLGGGGGLGCIGGREVGVARVVGADLKAGVRSEGFTASNTSQQGARQHETGHGKQGMAREPTLCPESSAPPRPPPAPTLSMVFCGMLSLS